MAATDRSTPGTPDASALAATCREAAFVQLVARADGDALAAAGILAAACEAVGAPYHVSAVRTRAELDATLDSIDDGATIPVGADDGTDAPDTTPLSVRAYDAAYELGTDPDPAPALAGIIAAGAIPGEAPTILDRAGVEQRPGVAVPTDDLADGLAHTTFAHADFSGDPEAVRAAIDGVDSDDADREAASLLALAAVGDPDASGRAATAIERALRPYAGGPFETLGGYADVLCALARTAPGLAITLALGRDARPAALDAWREHAGAVHGAVRSARTARYDGLLVARVDGPVEATARILRDFRSPEPVVLAVGNGEAGAAAAERSVADAIERAGAAADGSGLGRGPRGYARFESEEAFIDAFREAL